MASRSSLVQQKESPRLLLWRAKWFPFLFLFYKAYPFFYPSILPFTLPFTLFSSLLPFLPSSYHRTIPCIHLFSSPGLGLLLSYTCMHTHIHTYIQPISIPISISKQIDITATIKKITKTSKASEFKHSLLNLRSNLPLAFA